MTKRRHVIPHQPHSSSFTASFSSTSTSTLINTPPIMSSSDVPSRKCLPRSPPIITPPPPPPPTVQTPAPITSVTLPPAIYLSNRDMLAQIYDSVQSCDGLLPSERQILLGVLPNIPLAPDRSSFFARLLSLTPPHMKTLSQVLESGLLAARNFGGRPTSSADGGGTSRSVSKRSSVDDTVSDTFKRPRLVSMSPQLSGDHIPSDTPPSAPATPASVGDIFSEESMTAEICLLMHLGIYERLPNLLTSDRFSRGGNLSQDCLIRQGEVCPITGHLNNPFGLETAHLIPHSVAAIKTLDGTPFWLLLTICLGPDIRDQIYNVVGGNSSSCSTNGLSLDSNIHALFDRGVIWLIPLLDGPFDQTITTHYDVEFCWRGDLALLQSLGTVLPISPEDQVAGNPPRYNSTSPLRSIQNRDVFRLFTARPARYPLTHPLLLSLHNMFWLMIESSGLTETAKVKKARLGLTEGGRPHPVGDSRGRYRRSIPRTPANKPGKDHRNPTTRPSETQRPPPPAPTEENKLQAPPPIRMEYLDWKLNQLIALRSEITYAPDSDSEMDYMYSDSDSEMGCASPLLEYCWGDKSPAAGNGLHDECPCRNEWTAGQSEGLSC